MFNDLIEIDGRKVGAGCPPYVIAELSGNHNGDIERAKELIKVAQDSGADAVKLQTYTADSLVLNSDRPEFLLNAPKSTWNGRRLYELYEEAHTPREWHQELFDYARDIGISIFSAPFDIEAVNFLEDFNAPAYKVASNEIHDWPLLEKVVSTGKPLIISTGVATKEDVKNTLEFVRSKGAKEVIVLHCVSAYPAPLKDMHLNTMIDMRENFGALVGLSDHSLGVEADIAAISNGAHVIEKHITLDRNDGGPDSSFSLEPDELKKLCKVVKETFENPESATYESAIMGEVKYGGETDLKAKGIYTRQFWTIENIEQGDILSNDNIKSIRGPSDSGAVSTMAYQSVMGARAKHPIAKHEPLMADDVEEV
jgi:N-acetylneuraminate synthase